MKRTVTLSLAIAMLLCTGLAQTARADHISVEEIAKRCVDAASRNAERCVEANAKTTQRCLAAIEKHLEAGERRKAVAVARRCARLITRRSNACVDRIHEICEHCVNLLVKLDHPELARRVNNACEEIVAKVRESQRRAIGALRDALPDVAIDDAAIN